MKISFIQETVEAPVETAVLMAVTSHLMAVTVDLATDLVNKIEIL